MPVQGGNALNHGVAYAGMMTSAQVANTVSKLNKGTVNIAFGLGVITDGDDGAKLPGAGATAAQFVGVVRRELNRAYAPTDIVGAVAKFDASILTAGEIWVTAFVAVTKDQPVFLIVSDGTGTNQGKFTNIVGATTTLAVAIPNAKWTSSAGAGALAKISLTIGG